MQAVEAFRQPVIENTVNDRGVAERISRAEAGEKVRRVRHRLDSAAKNDVGVIRADGIGREHYGLHAPMRTPH